MSDQTSEREKNREKRKQKKEIIQIFYGQIIDNPPNMEALWGEMINLLDDYSRPIIYTELSKSPYRKKEDFEEVLGDAHKALLKRERILTNYGRFKINNPCVMFADYCVGIYRHKAKDYVAHENRAHENIDQKKDGSEEASEDNAANPAVMAETGELTDMELVVKYYVDEVVSCDDNRFQIMKLCYSRILPVISGRTNCSSADTWAWEQMAGKDMEELSYLFVDYFNAIMKHLRTSWSDIHWQMLEELFDSNIGIAIPIKEAVLTSEFTADQTKNWVPRMHERIMRRILPKICKADENDELDPEIVNMVSSYMTRIRRRHEIKC